MIKSWNHQNTQQKYYLIKTRVMVTENWEKIQSEKTGLLSFKLERLLSKTINFVVLTER